MARFATTVLVIAMLGAGMSALVPGAAIAQERGGDEQTGLANVDDTQTIVPVNACNNNVPVNVLGVQVPIQDVAGQIPVLSPVEHGSEQAAGVAKNCDNDVAAEND